MQISKIKQIIKENKLDNVANLLRFLEKEWNQYPENDLREIAELANANRQKNAAFYTDNFIVEEIISSLPLVSKEEITILEPSVGTGNFLFPIIERFKDKHKKITITVNDLDKNSLQLTRFFIEKKGLPKNVNVIFSNFDFLDDLAFYNDRFDYIIGNPPFQRISQKEAEYYGNKDVRNIAGFFLLKGISIADYLGLVMPKNLLSTPDFEPVRRILNKKAIHKISDFGEKGFKGVLIETISIIVTDKKPEKTELHSYLDNSTAIKNQAYITNSPNNTWLIYRNSFFDEIAKNMTFNIFTTFRDRQLTNSNTSNQGDIRIIKSRNIARDGAGIIDIPGYDGYISNDTLKKVTVKKYYNRDDVYLVPNMTYYPRMIKKPKCTVANGSVAILELKNGYTISDKEVKFFSSKKFQKFYKIARNKGTRSLNIDKTSVFWFGKYKE